MSESDSEFSGSRWTLKVLNEHLSKFGQAAYDGLLAVSTPLVLPYRLWFAQRQQIQQRRDRVLHWRRRDSIASFPALHFLRGYMPAEWLAVRLEETM